MPANNPTEEQQIPPSLPDHDVAAKTIRSGAWMYGGNLVTSVINLGVMAILARQLRPADFGLVALAQVLLRFLATLGSSGVGEYVIYDRAEGREERVQAAFWLGQSMSFAVVLVCLAAIPLLTQFYTEPGLDELLMVMLVEYLLMQLSTVPDALIKKTLNYQKLVIRDSVMEILASFGMAGMALAGFGVWSLVIPNLVVAPLRIILVMFMAHWYPKLPLRIRLWKGVFKFSANIVGTTLANTIAAEGDTLIIGKSLGTQSLGLYNLAWQSANLVPRNVTGVIGKLAMPALSAVAGEPARLRAAFYRIIRVSAIVSFPLLVGLFVVADKFIVTVYGLQWGSSIFPLQILLIYALRQAIGGPVSVIYNVVGRPDIGLKFNLGFIPFYLLSIWLGSFYGIVGVAIGVTVTRTLGGMVAFWIAARIIDSPFIDMLVELGQPLVASVLMGLVVFGFRLLLGIFKLPPWQELLALVGIGGITYLILLVTAYRRLLSELLSVVESFSLPFASFLRRLTVYKGIS